jgi:hypothetical protein
LSILKKNMKKAFSSSDVIKLVFAVIIFSFLVVVLWKVAGNVLMQIGEMLGIIQKSDVEKAILCSIYRCVEGCMSMKVQELSWKEGNKVVKCNDFCNPSRIQSEDPAQKVCGMYYPVEIRLDKSQNVDKSHLTLGSTEYRDVSCVLSSKSGGPSVWDWLGAVFGGAIWQQLLNIVKAITGGKASDNILVLDASIIGGYGTKEDCYSEIGGLTLSHEAYQQLRINPSKLKIYTDKIEFLHYAMIGTVVLKGD